MRLRTQLLFLCLLASVSPAQWEPDVRLTNDAAFSYTSIGNGWCVASSGGFVHAVWYDRRSFNYEIYYKHSTDGGTTWGDDMRLTSNALNSELPSVAATDSIVHVVWQDDRPGAYDIYYKRSSDGGTSWSTDNRLSNASRDSRYPSMALRGSVVHVVWGDERDGNSEVYYKRSTDGGLTWPVDTRLTTDADSSQYPSVAVGDSTVHVVWFDTRASGREVYYKRSTDGGVSWEPDARLSDTGYSSVFPSVTANGQVVNVAWGDARDGNSEIYCRRSTDGGSSWGPDTRLTTDTSYSYSPTAASDGQMVHVVWRDGRDGNDEIYYKRSTDRGATWEADTRLTDDAGQSRRGSVVAGENAVHVVWCDGRDGNPEVYYKRDPSGSVGEAEPGSRVPVAGRTGATVVRGVLRLPGVDGGGRPTEGELLNAAGRKVMVLRPGSNDVPGLAPGVYFVRMVDGERLAATLKVILTR